MFTFYENNLKIAIWEYCEANRKKKWYFYSFVQMNLSVLFNRNDPIIRRLLNSWIPTRVN